MKRSLIKILAIGMTAFLAISCGFKDQIATLQEQLDAMKKEQNELSSKQSQAEWEASKDRQRIEGLINETYGIVIENVEADQGAEYIGDLAAFIDENLQTVGQPDLLGSVYVKFIIDSEGNVQMPIIMKSLEQAKDMEAKRVCMLLKFKPAKVKGKAVPVYYILPFKFNG